MTLRDIGKRLAKLVPGIEPIARRLYCALPGVFHDTPTSRLRSYFRDAGQVTFVQIGAFDGVAGDPIRPLILEQESWAGLLVEPDAEAFTQLKSNYEAQADRLHFLNCAISDESGEVAFYSIAKEELEGLPAWAGEVASLDAAHIKKWFPEVPVQSTTVQALSFEDAVARFDLQRVDLIVMDVEGLEGRLLGAIDLARYRVKFLLYEHVHLPTEEDLRIRQRLADEGFSIKQFGRDTIAWR